LRICERFRRCNDAIPRAVPFLIKWMLSTATEGAERMADIVIKPKIKVKTKVKTKVERPRLHKVILVNDDFTPREFVVTVLKAEFRMTEDQAHKVMITAHQRGVCVVAVFTKDVAETKATRATDAGRAKGYPLLFTTEPEE
jgi:ATP-dependent Clp protease adaptor protein ClpS